MIRNQIKELGKERRGEGQNHIEEFRSMTETTPRVQDQKINVRLLNKSSKLSVTARQMRCIHKDTASHTHISQECVSVVESRRCRVDGEARRVPEPRDAAALATRPRCGIRREEE